MVDLEPRRNAVVVAFVLLIICCVGQAAVQVALAFGLSEEDVPATLAIAAVILVVAHLATWVAVVVTFLLWFHRAYGNLVGAGLDRLEFSPGWAVGGFFVPFLNLVRPYGVMKEVWRGSEWLATEQQLDDWKATPVSPLVLRWWLLFLGTGLIGNASERLPELPWLSAVWFVASMIAASVAIQLIHQVSQRQAAALAAR